MDVLGSVYFWWFLCLVWAGVQAVAYRHSMNPDGLSYLDRASEAVRRGPSTLISGYWSPGYPALISVGLLIFRPSASQEFPLVHGVNFFIFAFVLSGFTYFLKGWLVDLDGGVHGRPAERKYLVPFAFVTFLWFTLEFIGVGVVTPDLCVAAVVFFAAGLSGRFSRRRTSLKHYALLGFVLGLGYYAKPAMLPLSMLFLGVLFLYPRSLNVQRRRVLLSVSVFVLTAAPLVVLVSRHVGRPSSGEIGRLAYAWYVNGTEPFGGWTGGASDIGGVPEHPPRKLMEKPVVLEFASPIAGTYPLWYEPSYWYAGAKIRFNWKQQIAAFKEPLLVYADAIGQMRAFLIGAVLLSVLLVGQKPRLAFPWRFGWHSAWPLLACTMYAAVGHVEYRFLGAFLVLIWLAIYGALVFNLDRWSRVVVLATVCCAIVIPYTAEFVAMGVQTVRDLAHPVQPDYETVAVALRNIGVQNGDRLAIVGYGFDSYYARFDRLRVIAQIPSADEFWHLSAPERDKIAERLAGIGVRAVVARDRPRGSATSKWRDVDIPGSRFSILLLSAPAGHLPIS